MKAMTDREKLEELFNELGIGYKIKEGEGVGKVVIKIKEGYKNIGGYMDFHANFKFDTDGAFVFVDIIE